jgi:hypothetical protein
LLHREKQTPWKNYRADCQFRFALNDFPDEFNFSLIEQYGWYKAKNHGNNPRGVSRDHMVSIRFGFDNQIPPEIIHHPSNCELVCNNENQSKGKKNSISLDALRQRINEWNAKYSGC